MVDTRADNGRTSAEPSMTSLVGGIVTDIQNLTRQQFALFKAEVSADVRKSRDAALALGAGAAVLGVGGLLLAYTVVHFLQLLSGWHESTCEAVVGGVFVLIGGALFAFGKRKFDTFSPIPDQSIQALKENVQCLTNPK